MSGEVKTNLARKWRSKSFNEIVGQDLCVRMLKNSLYLQQYFPVYLFSGQRGCGKTSMARIFAMALNCAELPIFQKNPQTTSVPCLQCASCKAASENKHPDFIEIDAASHTGVDNVRSLIDSASLLPVMGRTKIYLVDEAHMLSKAAFNALLKILEEPPMGVIFILATTDPQKIIDTVRSRCFQLFFSPINDDVLRDRLRLICDTERITYDAGGLSAIVAQTEGCARDAINLLEQIRFSSGAVTRAAVLRVLGHLDDAQLIGMFERALCSSPQHLLQYIKDLHWEQYSAAVIWTRLLELARASLWIKYHVKPAHFAEYHATLEALVQRCTVQQLHAILETMSQYDTIFNRTTAKHDVLEMVLLHICYHHRTDTEGSASPATAQAAGAAGLSEVIIVDEDGDGDTDQNDDESEDDARARWKNFVAQLSTLNDPLVMSIFSQGIVAQYDRAQLRLEVTFAKEFVFFQDWLAQTEGLWKPLLAGAFHEGCLLVPSFTGSSSHVPLVRTKNIEPILRQGYEGQATQPRATQSQSFAPKSVRADTPSAQKYTAQRGPFRKPALYNPFAKESAIDTSDENRWPRVHLMLRYMPGAITKLPDEMSVL